MPVGRREAFSIQVLQIADALLVWMAFWIADLARGPIRTVLGLADTDVAGLGDMTWVLYLSVPFTPLVLEFFGFYRRLQTKSTPQSLYQLLRGLLVIALFLGIIATFAKLGGASRVVLGLGGLLVFAGIFARDRFVQWYFQKRTVRDELKERIVMAGSEAEVESFLHELDPDTRSGMYLVGRFDLLETDVSELYDLLKAESVERVIITAGTAELAKVSECVEACELQGVEAWVEASFMRTQVARPTFDVVDGRPMLVLRSTPELSWELCLKALIDRVGASLIILATLPLWLVAWIGIKITSPGAPAFFSQRRAGKYGKSFRMVKFRTMVPDAEGLLAGIKKDHGNQMQGPVFKLERDPRIFPFGAFLRKLSIDELPQLLNVMRGDMSLVGPRPLPLYEVEAFEKSEHRRRLSVKPGITCEWQCGGRNQISSFDQWVEMDLRYIDNWSLWLDVKILLKTVPAVLLGRGAG